MKTFEFTNFKNHMAMKKYLITLVFVAGAAALFTACTSESGGPSTSISYEQVKAAEQVPVTFGTYFGELATTRAGLEGPMTTAKLQNTEANGGGFGVFAYHTTSSFVAPNTTAKPNFMWNQLVKYNTSVWEYSPIKYWPNDFANGTAVDGQSTPATGSSGVQYLSFFAYAPYVSTPAAGVPGITAFTANTATTDPKVSYKIGLTPDKCVDLLWGVAGTSSDNVVGETNQPATAGMPFLNQTKQQVSGKINFAFEHALSCLDLTVQAARDQVSAGGTELWDAGVGAANKTRIYVDQVDITGDFPLTGDLNLNNTTASVPLWENQSNETGTVLSTTTGNSINPVLQYDNTFTRAGVLTTSATPLMNNGSENLSFMLIPVDLSAGVKTISFKITYRVLTQDAALDGGLSEVTNVITKTITGINFEGRKKYTFNLVLGMTSVKVTGTVEGWGPNTDAQVDLPLNVL